MRYLLAALFTLTACIETQVSKRPLYIGQWSGFIIPYHVEYEFFERTYVHRTYSRKMAVIKETKGFFSAGNNVFHFYQEAEYSFDEETLGGGYTTVRKNWYTPYLVTQDRLILYPDTADNVILERK